jgi:hypothetical protein
MTVQEIKKDLLSKVSGSYFVEPILGEMFARRSFGDLKEHYEVDDKTMMQALKAGGFSCYHCGDIDKIVFHKLTANIDCRPFTDPAEFRQDCDELFEFEDDYSFDDIQTLWDEV